ncbi:sugar phosphate isomerase/epimerase [Ilyomonas limi]|uniref:Sugar phosphate isomerase/epimerase n=1 Tax=Ilyomonas limi TaxID=2575867 RepID=A0A4V5UUK0_9BACT|nr:TIM barrel protein [Ilyomonas limi]TKK69343.1 sugar phosphate isomerase/epimerase [Ilyomonas limi]
MNTSRRTFLKQSSFALAGVSLLSNRLFAAAAASNEITGIQLYSVRDDMKKDPSGTLKQLADMGYKYVEHANYVNGKFYGYAPVDFKKLLDDLGLKMYSGHTVMNKQDWDEAKNDFTDKWKQTVADAAIVGQQYVISPWLDESMRNNMSDFKRYMDVFNKCGELCKKSGMKFGYHNHNFEFSTKLDGVRLYDLILKNTDPDLVAQQLDMGNMYEAGGIAMDVVKQYPGRFELMHVKDEIKSKNPGEMGGGYESTVLGKGVIPVKEVIDYGRNKGGTTQFIIEQESYQDKTPLECAKEDLRIMKGWGY